MSTPPPEALTSWAVLLAEGLNGATISLLGFLSSSVARPTVHLLLSALPLSFQPPRSLPLKGITTLPESWAPDGTEWPARAVTSTGTTTERNRRMVQTPGGMRKVHGRAATPRPGETARPRQRLCVCGCQKRRLPRGLRLSGGSKISLSMNAAASVWRSRTRSSTCLTRAVEAVGGRGAMLGAGGGAGSGGGGAG